MKVGEDGILRKESAEIADEETERRRTVGAGDALKTWGEGNAVVDGTEKRPQSPHVHLRMRRSKEMRRWMICEKNHEQKRPLLDQVLAQEMLLEAAKALCMKTVSSSKNPVKAVLRREGTAMSGVAVTVNDAEDEAQVGAGGGAPAMAEVAVMRAMWTVMAAGGAAAAAGGGNRAHDQGGGAPAAGAAAAAAEADAGGEGPPGG
mmetsp:Transcript_23246/g.45110  ORF Transcript_23246/g.45110 Transcript_23246/m.45110 type:complete len:204 (-) Transcript_23246:64-675(-)